MPTLVTLAAKEFRESLLTLRFQAGTALAVLLVAVSVWALVDDHADRVAGHSRVLALNETHLAVYGLLFTAVAAFAFTRYDVR